MSSVWLGAWQSDYTDYRRFVLTRPDGTFILRIPNGAYRLHVYAAPKTPAPATTTVKASQPTTKKPQ